MSQRGAAQAPSVVVHLVGRATDVVTRFVVPAADALAANGTRQLLIAIDDAGARELAVRLEGRVEVLLARDHAVAARRWQHLVRVAASALRREPAAAVHLHGRLAGAVGDLLLRLAGALPRTIYLSPHGSGFAGSRWPSFAASLSRLARPLAAPLPRVPIAHARSEARRYARSTGRRVDVVEGPVDDAYFAALRREAPRALIVSGSRAPGDGAIAPYTQLSVMLGGSGLDLAFDWLGPVDARAGAQFAAAAVAHDDPASAAARAAKLARGWVYVATGRAGSYPLELADAMAVGLPVVALATPQHRDLIEHGRTGLIGDSVHALLLHVAELLDDAARREALGAAARAEAWRRFSRAAFRRTLLAAYGGDPELPAGPPKPACRGV